MIIWLGHSLKLKSTVRLHKVLYWKQMYVLTNDPKVYLKYTLSNFSKILYLIFPFPAMYGVSEIKNNSKV